jgi:molybdopterin molybdotransferase
MSHEPPIPVAVALSRVMETFDAVDGSEVVDLPCALGRILIEPLVAPVDVPALATSAMDGVALCARDIEGKALPLELTLLGRVLAGHLPDLRPGPGQCVRIMTGALLPEGCDTVVLQEDIVLLDGAVRIVEPVTPGANVRRPGEQWCSGDVCLDAGERLRPADLQTAAMLGLSPLRVRRAPRVAILSSGDEVQALGSSLHEGEVFDSNRQFLLAALAQLGVTVIDLGIVADAADLLATAVARAALEADLLLTTGGRSRGPSSRYVGQPGVFRGGHEARATGAPGTLP